MILVKRKKTILPGHHLVKFIAVSLCSQTNKSFLNARIAIPSVCTLVMDGATPVSNSEIKSLSTYSTQMMNDVPYKQLIIV
jgi:hypothetical protein